jgi:hypothetical protein
MSLGVWHEGGASIRLALRLSTACPLPLTAVFQQTKGQHTFHGVIPCGCGQRNPCLLPCLEANPCSSAVLQSVSMSGVGMETVSLSFFSNLGRVQWGVSRPAIR